MPTPPTPPQGKSRRRLATAATISTGLLVLTACASGGTAAEERPEFVFINPAPGVPAWQTIADCFEAQAEARGVEGTVVGSSGSVFDAVKTLEHLEQAIALGADGVALNTSVGSDTLATVLTQAAADGVIVGTIESGDDIDDRTFDVGIDIQQYARDVAAYLSDLPGEKNVAFLTIAFTGTPKIFLDTFEAEIADDPSIRLVTTVPDNGDVTKDAEITSAILAAHPETDYILAVNPAATAGIVTGITEAGHLGKTRLIGLTLDDSARAALDSGAAEAFYVQQMCDVGTLAVDAFADAHEGRTVDKSIPVETGFATKDNYADLGDEWA